ncbi:MAG: class I tRNA ligase family protein [Candidatus Beckwithbacteria bacterium]|nr:class I tRNA ligase family protein [Candidatus Beckwithbacteria bacterium]
MNFDHQKIEEKWRKKWRETGIYRTNLSIRQAQDKKKWYNLMMFPYPSAEGLHVGNMYAFTGADCYGRFKAMQGYEVFEPIGLDGFGIHSENYAIKIGKHPADQAKISEKHFYEQLSRIGNRFNWDNRLETYDPEYYRWTQWLFVQMFKHGLAYRKKAQVNWCPSCKTVLADEQVIDGKCERCSTAVGKRENEQWFFKITEYAQRLLDNIEKIDWPEKIKISQRNWIGRSEGVEIIWKMTRFDLVISTFTTRPDTIYGATFLVLAPELALVNKLKLNKAAKEYVAKALLKTEQQRKLEEKKKTGVDTGYQVVHPLTGKPIPVWIADFVLKDYGTGAVMGVPAHDERDNDFAKEHQLPVIDILKDKEEIIRKLEKKGLVKRTVNFHLRDWCISRQRYWGPPIPMIYCEECAKRNTPESKNIPLRSGMAGWYPEKEENLPVKLPYVQDFKPTGDGRAPLAKAPRGWLETVCPGCGGKAKREIDVSDTFLDSAWYFLRYPSVSNKETPRRKPTRSLLAGTDELRLPFDPEITKNWLPVDAYIGGAEHAVLHLLYSRFVWMALSDWGYIPKALGPEPFPFLYGHGLIIRNGAKMSKSRGNIVNPDEYIDKFGADALRMYLMFIGPYDQGGDFKDTGIVGMKRFLNRVWNLCSTPGVKDVHTPGVLLLRHKTVKKLTEAMENFRFNVGIANIMEYVNGLEKYFTPGVKEVSTPGVDSIKTLILLLAPFAPYISEELWGKIGGKFSVHQQLYPKYEEKLTKNETVTVVVQVNGKLRGRLELGAEEGKNKEKVLTLAKADEHIKQYLKDKKIVKEIFVPGKLVNLVVK